MKIGVLASGSSGNCFYIEQNNQAILVDAGISAKQIIERIDLVGASTDKIKAIFVTHEHSDHIKGIDVFARKFNLPIFATKKTAESCFLCSEDKLINKIKNSESIEVGNMRVEAFTKSHKAVDPVSFNIFGKKKVSIITDAGFACTKIKDSVSDSDFLCLESNHNLEMLESGPYPYFLKSWIKSDIGHLSNNQAGLCTMEYARKKLKNIVLCHISKTNNLPETALKDFNYFIKQRKDLSPKIYVSWKEPILVKI